MNVSLTPELEQLVNDKVNSGMYQTSSEVVREGLRLLKERDDLQAARTRDVRAGFEAIDRGEFAEYAANAAGELAGRVKSRGRHTLAAEDRKTVVR